MPRRKRPRPRISSLAEFVRWVEEVGDYFTSGGDYEVPWFRGTGDSRFHLVPDLYRSAEGRRPNADDELRCEFMRKALPLVAERAPRDDWEWYFLMQHQRAPTRLLDWTDAALVALYFALSTWSNEKKASRGRPRPGVWALNPFALNRKSGLGFQGPAGTDPRVWEGVRDYLPKVYSGRKKLPRYPIAIDPSFAAHRMLVQHSHFTLHGRDRRGLDQMTELKLESDLFLVIVALDAGNIERLRWHLTVAGITETTIFPDLEGLARELRVEYRIP